MFFNDWWSLLRILTVGSLAYFALIFWLRVSGKRTLSKWNAFDFVVTIALGSILATVITSKDVVLSEGILALVLLIGLQFIITSLSIRIKWIRQIIKSNPAILYDKGNFIHDKMKVERVVEGEIFAAVRASGTTSMEEVETVVLETDGSFSVMKKSDNSSRSALSNIENADSFNKSEEAKIL